MTKRFLMVLLACAGCMTLAQAELLPYRYDFENVTSEGYYTLGSYPAATTPARTTCSNSSYRGFITNAQSYTGTQSLLVRNSGATTGSAMERAIPFTPTADGIYTYSADMYVTSQYNSVNTAYSAGLYAAQYTAGPSWAYPCGVTLNKTSAGVTSLKYTNVTTKTESIDASLFEDKWVVIEMLIDNPNSKYSFTIYNADKTQVLASKTNMSFSAGTYTINALAIYTEKAAAAQPVQVYYDNLSVVPEPMTMSLLVAGLGVVFLKRRK